MAFAERIYASIALKGSNMQARKIVAFDDILRIFEYYNFLQIFLEVIRLL